MAWTHENLATQGYCLSAEEARRLRAGLRFPTALCLALVVPGLILQSALAIGLLVPIGAVAGWSSRHPFDHLWNHGARHLTGAPPLPPNPTRRRHAFKLATIWLATVAVLFAAGQPTVALVLGGVLVSVCSLVTVTNFCIPSTMLAWLEGRRRREANCALIRSPAGVACPPELLLGGELWRGGGGSVSSWRSVRWGACPRPRWPASPAGGSG
jgi:hypothetical protein